MAQILRIYAWNVHRPVWSSELFSLSRLTCWCVLFMNDRFQVAMQGTQMSIMQASKSSWFTGNVWGSEGFHDPEPGLKCKENVLILILNILFPADINSPTWSGLFVVAGLCGLYTESENAILICHKLAGYLLASAKYQPAFYSQWLELANQILTAHLTLCSNASVSAWLQSLQCTWHYITHCQIQWRV